MEKKSTARGPVVWFEVEDLIRHFDWASHPGGMHRVCIEILIAAHKLDRGDVRFCRLSQFTGRLIPLQFEMIESAYFVESSALRWSMEASGQIWRTARNVRRVFRWLWRRSSAWICDMLRADSGSRQFESGDILIALGSPWDNRRYAEHVTAARKRFDLRLAILIHDIIPLSAPQFVPPRRIVQFRRWLEGMVTSIDLIVTPSRYSRSQIAQWAAQEGWPQQRIEVVRFGDGVNYRTGGDKKIELPKTFALFVSTIEARKNHRLLVRVWERLLARYGATAVPSLVWVGDRGWLVGDLLAELRRNQYLDGKIVVISDLSDAGLSAAYQRCAFTLFPSWCEGWGLPVAEGLTFGKFCIASNRTSLPEIAGSLIDYFDPSSEEEAFRMVERAIVVPGYLEMRTDQILREYKPALWSDCARSIIDLAGRIGTKTD